jgi:hypothetical protein
MTFCTVPSSSGRVMFGVNAGRSPRPVIACELVSLTACWITSLIADGP